MPSAAPDLTAIAARLRAAGCVYAEEEAAEIVRVLDGPDQIDAAVIARSEGRPLEQVVGRTALMGVEVLLGEGVFVPRRRTEALVETALAAVSWPRVVVDLGCGSGALAAGLASRMDAAVHGCEVDPAAVVWARRNGRSYGFTVHHGSWWDALPLHLQGAVDLAVAYLPHVPTGELDRIHADFRRHEPRLSVDGGADGLDPLRAVAAGLDRWLSPRGVFVTLLAAEQEPACRDVLGGFAVTVEHHDDDIVVVVRRPTAQAAR